MTWAWLKCENLNRETESLLIVTQNNSIRLNHVKTKIDNVQKNSGWSLYRDKGELENHIISECSKLAQKKYKVRLHGKGDHLEIVQDIKIRPWWKIVYTPTRICHRKFQIIVIAFIVVPKSLGMGLGKDEIRKRNHLNHNPFKFNKNIRVLETWKGLLTQEKKRKTPVWVKW